MHVLGQAKKEVDYEIDVDSKTIRERMKATTFRCMRNYPFYGTIALTLQLEEVEADSWIKTAAVDNSKMYYNKHFINALDNEELLFLFAHEVLHIVLKHLSRRGNRDAQVWNEAGDMVINSMLVEAGVGKFPSVGGLYDEKYSNMTTDKVYDELYVNRPPNTNFDQHILVNIGGGGGNNDDSNGNPQDSITLSADEVADMEAQVEAQIIQAMSNANKTNSASQVPAGIRRMIEDLTDAKVPWRSFLHETARSQVKSDYTWAKPNRRYQALGVIIPSIQTENHFEFTIGIDTSGSISTKMLQDFVGEIYYISRSFRSFKVQVFQYDTKVYGFREFDQNNINEMLEYEIKGGGGTCFDAAYEYFKEHDIKPHTYINFTDGQPWSSWGDEDYCRTIFMIHDEGVINNKVKAPFGTTLYYDQY